jgi:hypothetical protein
MEQAGAGNISAGRVHRSISCHSSPFYAPHTHTGYVLIIIIVSILKHLIHKPLCLLIGRHLSLLLLFVGMFLLIINLPPSCFFSRLFIYAQFLLHTTAQSPIPILKYIYRQRARSRPGGFSGMVLGAGFRSVV